MGDEHQEALRGLPSITELLKCQRAVEWLGLHPQAEVSRALREAVAVFRSRLVEGPNGEEPTADAVLDLAKSFLQMRSRQAVRRAINATGIILHTGLGRAVLAAEVVDSIVPELKGCCTMAVDPETGERAERDELLEPLLCDLTGAPAATVVNNNAAATLLVLKALAAGGEVIVSRGQLIEIGGSFRLPEVMIQSGARLVEVGATNRTHLKDYQGAITEHTRAILRVHPSNYRVVGFTSQPGLAELAQLAHRHELPLVDDLGAGAMVDLRQFGLPHEPTIQESLRCGADVVLFSGDKLLGASQAGIILGRADLIRQIRKHPLMRAVRVDKTCLLLLERTLRLFRAPDRLGTTLPTYAMASTPLAILRQRAETLAHDLALCDPRLAVTVEDSQAYLGSGTLPTEAIPSVMVALSHPKLSTDELALRLRRDETCVFGRIQSDRVCLDLRTIRETEVPLVVAALKRALTRLPEQFSWLPSRRGI